MCLAGYRDVCTRPLVCEYCGGTEWTTVLATSVELYIYILYLYEEMRYAIIALVVACLVH